MGQDATTGGSGAVDLARELEQRLALATPDKTRRGMFMKGILEVEGPSAFLSTAACRYNLPGAVRREER